MNSRSRICFALSFAVLGLSASSSNAAETLNLDQSHCSIVFSVSHMNRSYTYGIFRQAQGRVMLDSANPAGCQFQLSISADSIDTNQPKRDQHLKSPDFFNVAEFPAITFESTSCTQANSQQGVVYQVTGNLTMHGVTRQITLPVQMLGAGPGPGGQGYSAGFMTQFELKRSDFGMTNLLDMVGDAIGISVSFEAMRQEGGEGAPPGRPR